MAEMLFKYESIKVELPAPHLAKFRAEDGKAIILKVYPITDLAKNLNRSTYTIRRWEANGWIPKSWRIKNKGRYYTKSQIQLMTYLSMRHAIQIKEQVGKAMPQEFIDAVFEHMDELTTCTLRRQCIQDMVEEGASNAEVKKAK